MSHPVYEELAPKVERVANAFSRRSTSRHIGTREDVVQEAYRGLGEALERFNPDHPDANRDGYLMTSVSLHLRKASCDLGLIKIPTNLLGRSAATRRPKSAAMAFRARQTAPLDKLSHLKPSSPDKSRTVLMVRDAVERLPRYQRDVIERRFGFYGDPMTLDEVAEDLGIAHCTVFRREKQAMEKLRVLLA